MRSTPFAIALLATGVLQFANPPAHGAAKPNVLFVMADDLNCDLGCYGHGIVQSPNIDRLAARGLRFERAYCQFPLCGPSRASLMCGLYPDQTLVTDNAIRVRERVPNVVTMPQMFRSHDYTAVRVGKIYHYGVPTAIGTDGHDDPESWQRVVNPRGRDKDEEQQIFSLRPGQFGGTLSWLAADGEDREQTDGVGAAAAVTLLDEFAASNTPFFLAVGFYRPHTPYVAPRKYFDLYPTDSLVVPSVPAGYLETLPAGCRTALARNKLHVDLPDETARRAIQAYYASITFMDAQLGVLLDALDRLGLAENTIVVFVSDHGYHMGEHGYYMKRTLFENAARVPLIVAVPGMKTAGQSTASLVEMVDLYPTLADACGLALSEGLPGTSLSALLSDAAAQPRDSALTQMAGGYALRTPRYRYVEWGNGGAGQRELYDHQTDAAEMVNLAERPERAAVVAELSQQLSDRVREARQKPATLVQTPPERPRAGTGANRGIETVQ